LKTSNENAWAELAELNAAIALTAAINVTFFINFIFPQVIATVILTVILSASVFTIFHEVKAISMSGYTDFSLLSFSAF
jgi:hypothetical protein